MDSKSLYKYIKSLKTGTITEKVKPVVNSNKSTLGALAVRQAINNKKANQSLKDRYPVYEEETNASSETGGKMLITFADYDPFETENKKSNPKKKAVDASSKDTANTSVSGDTTKIDFDPEQRSLNGY